MDEYIRYLSCACDNSLDQINAMKIEFISSHNSKLIDHLGGKLWDGCSHHIHTKEAEGRGNVCAQLNFFFLFSSGPQPMEWCFPQLKLVSPL